MCNFLFGPVVKKRRADTKLMETLSALSLSSRMDRYLLENSLLVEALDDGSGSAYDNLRQYVVAYMPGFPIEMLDAWKRENEGKDAVAMPVLDTFSIKNLARVVAWLDFGAEIGLSPLETWARCIFVHLLCSPSEATDDELFYAFVRDKRHDDPVGGRARKIPMRSVLSRCMSYQTTGASAPDSVFRRIASLLSAWRGRFVIREDLLPYNARVWKFDAVLEKRVRHVTEMFEADPGGRWLFFALLGRQDASLVKIRRSSINDRTWRQALRRSDVATRRMTRHDRPARAALGRRR